MRDLGLKLLCNIRTEEEKLYSKPTVCKEVVKSITITKIPKVKFNF